MGKNKIGIWFDEETNVLYVSLFSTAYAGLAEEMA
jgi:hypothetical protein